MSDMPPSTAHHYRQVLWNMASETTLEQSNGKQPGMSYFGFLVTAQTRHRSTFGCR